MRFSLPGSLLLAACLCSCATTPAPIISQSPNPPLIAHIEGKYVDDDSPPNYVLRFRNLGSQIVSYEYTAADRPGVPHIDRDGPNSGFIANHYPGSVVEVTSPVKTSRVFITLGRLRPGKLVAVVSQPAASSAPISLSPSSIEPEPLPQNQ